MKKSLKICISALIAITFCVAGFLGLKTIQVYKGKALAQDEYQKSKYAKLQFNGSVKHLSIIPLIDYYADDPVLKTESGVSYLIKADDTTILFDVGFNQEKNHPSPLLYNMHKLGIKIKDISMIFISHPHVDHIGGFTEQSTGTFSLSKGFTSIEGMPVYAPEGIFGSSWNKNCVIHTVTTPLLIQPGIASIGVIPRYLFIMGKINEQCLAINIQGKGIALIIGCGHPSIERIIERTKMLFNEPIYAIIGGLHFPIHGGRSNIGPINIQYIVGTDSPAWNGLNESDLYNAIQIIKTIKPSILALSPHDSSDWALDEFSKAFYGTYSMLKVGKEIKIH